MSGFMGGLENFGETGLGAVIGALITFFIANHHFKKYIQDAVGKGEKREISPQPLRIQNEIRMATHDELVQLRREFESFCVEQRDNNEARQTQSQEQTEEIFSRINAVNENLAARITNIGIDMATAIGELKGEIKRL